MHILPALAAQGHGRPLRPFARRHAEVGRPQGGSGQRLHRNSRIGSGMPCGMGR
jgi:hypothetical protein